MGDVKQFNGKTQTADQTLVTTAELLAVATDPIVLPGDQGTVFLIGWAQVTTGTNTTALTFRIRRGNGITGTVVGEANATQVAAAAGSTEDHSIIASEFRSSAGELQYSLTVQQTAASANGTIVQSGLLVVII